jgi:hypothetical protein
MKSSDRKYLVGGYELGGMSTVEVYEVLAMTLLPVAFFEWTRNLKFEQQESYYRG